MTMRLLHYQGRRLGTPKEQRLARVVVATPPCPLPFEGAGPKNMIIETHSPEEVIAEAFRDLPAMWNKMKEPLKRLQRRVKVDKSILNTTQLFPYRSHSGNNWLVAVLCTKKCLRIAPFVWYRGRDGAYRAARVVEDGVSYHITHHVLEQYFNRFNRTCDGMERMKEFVRENMMFGAEHGLDNNEIRVGISHGYITGRWIIPHQVAQLTTFVDHGKLFQDQIEQMDRLDEWPMRDSGMR